MMILFLILNEQLGLSPLHYAAKKGHEQLVTFLLENGTFKEITGRV